MIITCPTCKTQYDVEETRFQPDGRSVRCAECEESWFIPAPEPIESLSSLSLSGIDKVGAARCDDKSRRDHAPDDRVDADVGPGPTPRPDADSAQRPLRYDRVQADAPAMKPDAARAHTATDDVDIDPIRPDASGADEPENKRKERRGKSWFRFSDDTRGDRQAAGDRDQPSPHTTAHESEIEEDPLFSEPPKPAFGRNKNDHKSDGDRHREELNDPQQDGGWAYDENQGRMAYRHPGPASDDMRMSDGSADDGRADGYVDGRNGRRDERHTEDMRDAAAQYRDRGHAYDPDHDGRDDHPRTASDMWGGAQGWAGDDREWRDDAWRDSHDRGGAQYRPRTPGRAANRIVDADFEDLGDPDGVDLRKVRPRERHGPRIRDERRRSTALTRIDDLEPLAERVFNDEFFTALRVQPRELEKAMRKARRRAEARDKNRMTPMKALGWSAWAGAVAATLFIGLTYKDRIVAMFPNAAQAYNAVGLETPVVGLAIQGVTHRVALSPQGPVIEITGQLKNDAARPLAAPLLQAEALGADGGLLSRWVFAANADEVAQGGMVEFVTRAPAPDGVAEVALTFAPAEAVRVSISQ